MNRPLKSDSRKSIAWDDIHDCSPVEQYFLLRVDESDRIIAQAMNSLSTEEREKVMEEVHCVSKPIEEKTDFILEKLAELDCEVSIRENEAYEIGSKQKRGFVEDLSFRCMFLRCNSFVASAASKRMMHHLKLKETYFGEQKITKDIGFLDLSEEDIRSLESGVIQVLPEKDRSGRAVIAVFPFMWNGDNPQSMLRASYFLEMSLVQDPDVQRRGVVYIYYDTPDRIGLSHFDDAKVVSLYRIHKASMPVRYAAYHVCLRDRSGYQSIGHAMSTKTEDIVKGISHYGDDKECLQKLQGFGIPVPCFPMNTEGTMDRIAHKKWVQQKKKESAIAPTREPSLVALGTYIAVVSVAQRLTEADETASSGSAAALEEQENLESSDTPSMKALSASVAIARAAHMAPKSDIQPIITDVVFGRGRCLEHFPGNVSFYEVVDERAAE